jgi:hypothetical protein
MKAEKWVGPTKTKYERKLDGSRSCLDCAAHGNQEDCHATPEGWAFCSLRLAPKKR